MITVQDCAISLGILLLASCGNAATNTPAATPKPLPKAPEGVIIQENVAYLSPGREEKLDLYLPADRPLSMRSPAVVIIHGGGWRSGDKAAGREFNIGTNLAKAGYVCASINYTLEAGNCWPTNLWDCKNAVRFLRANSWRYQIDPEHIGVIGGSAGGHLALMVAYTSSVPEFEPPAPDPGISDKVSAVVDLYGITNLLSCMRTDTNGVPTKTPMLNWSILKDPKLQHDREAWKLASPFYQATKTSPPTLILHGTADTTVDRNQATELAARLKELGVEHQIFMLDGIGHTFDLETWNKKPLPIDVRSIVIGFFDKHLKAKG